MKHSKTNLIAFAILVLGWSLVLSGLVHGLSKYALKHPAKDKPGYSEIRTVAKEYNLTQREVKAAVRDIKGHEPNLPEIIISNTITMGFTLGLFVLIRKLVSRFTERK